ncbi:MAG: nickel-responsive transcriptional regulator NikR [Gammaproteobacteria bacterium]|nr:nickel-responsive transcriptional regulator NikR [Gammaproteobacteria bacterium]
MERFTMSLEDDLARQFDDFIKEKGYSNRSEAMRDLIRDKLEHTRLHDSANSSGKCVAGLSYVYNHHESGLASKIVDSHHQHHDLTVSTLHVHLDHDNCLETVILKGDVAEVRQFSNAIKAVRGVRHGHLHMVPVEVSESSHSADGKVHTHSKPKT